MKLKVIIIDDEIDAVNLLESIIESKSEAYEIVGKTTNPLEGTELIIKEHPDVVFLDIEMPLMNGFELLQTTSGLKFEVIFATAYENYALKAIKENALDYILKPITPDEVFDALNKATNRLANNSNPSERYKDLINKINHDSSCRQKFPITNGFELIELKSLMYLEASGTYTLAHLSNGDKIMLSKSIKFIEPIVNSDHFFRAHRSFIININFIKRFDRNPYKITLTNNTELPLSRRRYESFLKVMNQTEG